MIGTRINDRYQVDRELGQGGMGTVYKGYDTTLGRDVAIKMLTEYELGTEGRSRLLREAQTIARLSHPNIVTVHDVGKYENTPFIVMEFVEGENLYVQPPKDIEAIVAVAQQLCAALTHAHEHSIIHRDLKPENVILTSNGTVKLMDFGLAHPISSRLTTEGTILGTVFYLAPEQAQGKTIDQRADLYSLGVMLYELTTGELPFTADDPLGVISQHIHAPVIPPRAKNERISPALEALILQLMKKDPAERPISAAEVLKQLSAPEILDVDALPKAELSVLDRIVRGRMVGREKELRWARQAWGQAMSGQGQLLLISGEAGVGKTRLMREIVTQAELSGGSALVGRSYAKGDPPYAPFRQILRAGLDTARESGQEIPQTLLVYLLKIAPELRPDFPDIPVSDADEPENIQQNLFDQFLTLFTLLTKHRPVLLVLEDIHWTDASSLKLLRHLVCNTRSQQLMVLVTYRDVSLDEARPLHEMLLDFQREKIGVPLKLKRLTRLETNDLLAILFAEEITPEFLEGIYRETDGNPFFIEEVCKAIVESGKLTFEEGCWRQPSMEEVGVPHSIQVAIQERLEGLSKTTQRVLEQAAILGREFDFQLLHNAMDTDEDSLLDALDEAMHARLVEEVGADRDDRFSFVHALVPTTIAVSLRTLLRRKLHRRAAETLETLQPEAYEVLAYQFIEAGETDRGVDYLIKAGDRARSIFAHDEAIESYRQAVDHLIEAGADVKAARTLMKLGLAYHSDFQLTAACQAYDQAFHLYQQAGRLEEGETLLPAPHAHRFFFWEPSSLDPNLDVTGWAVMIIENIFSGLVELTSEWEVVPDVASRWEVLDGGRRYVFYLREDFTWSDGVPVTARDFEYTWKRAIDPASKTLEVGVYFILKNAEAYHLGLLDQDAVGVHARDDFTLEVELESPSISFLYLLSTYFLFPLPRHVLKKHGSAWLDLENLVTNGPFQLIKWKPGKSMDFDVNPAYPGRFPGNVQQIHLCFLDGVEPEDRLEMYVEDKIDTMWLGLLPNPKRARWQYADEFVTAPSLLVDYFGFNTKLPPCDDPRVRKALAMAVDREHLINTIYEGGGVFPAPGGLLPPGMPGYTEGIVLPYDPNQARRLLAEAGYPNGHGFPVIKARFWGPNTFKIVGTQWQENLGIEIKVDDFHWLEREGREDLHIWIDETLPRYPDPELLFNGPILLDTGWIHEEFKALIKRASAMMDYEGRLNLYRQAEQIVVKEVPALPIAYRRFDFLWKPWMRNFPVSPSKGWYWKETIIEQH